MDNKIVNTFVLCMYKIYPEDIINEILKFLSYCGICNELIYKNYLHYNTLDHKQTFSFTLECYYEISKYHKMYPYFCKFLKNKILKTIIIKKAL
jgi:hypothetical protein